MPRVTVGIKSKESSPNEMLSAMRYNFSHTLGHRVVIIRYPLVRHCIVDG